ncbi:hypothetical protein X766_09040 [Mesorhizobium sp. LSJC255A00]|nr:hypothetical protein X766_09040 [Mesorhizobium sp. LSJC255A00]
MSGQRHRAARTRDALQHSGLLAVPLHCLAALDFALRFECVQIAIMRSPTLLAAETRAGEA